MPIETDPETPNNAKYANKAANPTEGSASKKLVTTKVSRKPIRADPVINADNRGDRRTLTTICLLVPDFFTPLG
tara:strand:- start:738 stop:959 length:222 start_codon:yes stop_codon:yes gene_type:complete